MRPARCCAPTWRPLRPMAISPGTARSAIASCGSPWSPGRPRSPTGRPRPLRTSAGTRTKDPRQHDHRPGDSAFGQWQARSWQASGDVTVVTETVFRPGDFTPPLQLVNLICAIARGGRSREDRSVRGCPTASGTLTHTPAQTRSQTHERPRRPPEADRPPGSDSGSARARERPGKPSQGASGRSGSRPERAPSGHKKDRAGPGGVQRDRYDENPWNTGMTPVGAGVRRVELWAGDWGWGTRQLPGCCAVLRYCCAAVIAGRQGCVRPRCAAAEYPRAVRGPLPRGTGDVHRACGWT